MNTYAIVRFDESVADSQSARHLQGLLQQLVGLPFLFFDFTYPDQLVVNLGEVEDYRHPKLAGVRRGSHQLLASVSEWAIRSGVEPMLVMSGSLADSPSVRDVSGDDLAKGGVVTPGSRLNFAFVEAATPGGFGLTLWFADGSFVRLSPVVRPTGEGPWKEEVPDWELFVPLRQHLRVGPGRRWTYLPSRKAALAGNG